MQSCRDIDAVDIGVVIGAVGMALDLMDRCTKMIGARWWTGEAHDDSADWRHETGVDEVDRVRRTYASSDS